MRILTVPEDMTMLRSKSRPIEKIDAELLAFLKELGETLKRQKDPAGVGLSAIQVGKPLRVFTTFLPQIKNEKLKMKNEKPELIFYVNPEMVEHAAEMTLGEDLVKSDPPKATHLGGQKRLKPFLEGCLSIPRIYGPVLRYPWINAKAMVIGGDLYYPDSGRCEYNKVLASEFKLGGLAARVFQHELDHLSGILFTDHVLAQGNLLYQDTGSGMEEVNL